MEKDFDFMDMFNKVVNKEETDLEKQLREIKEMNENIQNIDKKD